MTLHPNLEIGIIRRGYQFQVMGYFPHSASEERKLENEMEFVVKTSPNITQTLRSVLVGWD